MSGLKRNIVATVPATLAEGHEVFVGSGTQYTHYIGNASNVPVPVKGYLEYSANIYFETGSISQDVLVNDFSQTITPSITSISGLIDISGITLSRENCNIQATIYDTAGDAMGIRSYVIGGDVRIDLFNFTTNETIEETTISVNIKYNA